MTEIRRNVNLEEIDSDALFGIDALKNQTALQKIIFFGSIGGGVLLNVCLPLFFGTSRILCVLLFLGLLVPGIAFGCNYTEDMTYGKYLWCFLFQPGKELLYQPTEDVEAIRERTEEVRKQEEVKLLRARQADPESQKKMLIRLAAFAAAVAVGTGSLFIVHARREAEEIHHTVEEKGSLKD